MLECVINLSEGRDRELVAEVAATAGRLLLDIHTDPDHNRAVLTLCGPDPDLESAVRAVARAAVERLDITRHQGVHPRIGVLDVVPFVALARAGGAGAGRAGGGGPGGGPLGSGLRAGRLADGHPASALGARDRFARWAGPELALPCFLYGPERTLPDLRRQAWTALRPDHGPASPHPTAGATAVGARPVLVAYNLWLPPGTDLAVARAVARSVRRPGLRTLGLPVGDAVQVSCNLISPWQLGPGAAYDLVALELAAIGGGAAIERAELVGLIPAAVLGAEPPARWPQLGLSPDQTIEARLEKAGLDGGSF